MILGIGCCARSDTLALARHALGLGVTNLLMLPPFFYKNNSDEGLYRAFAEVIDALAEPRLALLLYHFPQMSGVPVTHPVVERLLERYPDTLEGIKDSSGDWEHTASLISNFPEPTISSGAAGHLVRNLEAGGAGTFSAAANLAAGASAKVFKAFNEGDREAAEAGMQLVTEVRNVLTSYPLVLGIKHVIAAGQHDEVLAHRPPAHGRARRHKGEALVAALDQAGYVYDPDLYSVFGA